MLFMWCMLWRQEHVCSLLLPSGWQYVPALVPVATRSLSAESAEVVRNFSAHLDRYAAMCDGDGMSRRITAHEQGAGSHSLACAHAQRFPVSRLL